MKTFLVPSESKKKIIKDYIKRGFTHSEIARELKISKQLVGYWVEKLKHN